MNIECFAGIFDDKLQSPMYVVYCVLVRDVLLVQVVRNVVFEPRLLPGGGATEMAVSQALSKKAKVRLYRFCVGRCSRD